MLIVVADFIFYRGEFHLYLIKKFLYFKEIIIGLLLYYLSILNHYMLNQIWLFLQNLFIRLQITATAFPLAFLPVILVLCSIEKVKSLVHIPLQKETTNRGRNKF
jgi:hypothetical protein